MEEEKVFKISCRSFENISGDIIEVALWNDLNLVSIALDQGIIEISIQDVPNLISSLEFISEFSQ